MKMITLLLILCSSYLIFPQHKYTDSLGLSTIDELAYSTVRMDVDGNSGTSFFYIYDFKDSTSAVVLVTNKHVIKDGKVGTFYLTKRNADGSPNNKSHIPVVLDNFEKRWIQNPDPKADLAIMIATPLLVAAHQKGTPVFFISLDKNLIPSEKTLKNLTTAEDVIMVGYPVGVWDEVNNLPIFRRGISATHPAIDYDGRKEFLIDCASYPGSSGSPVFLINLGSYFDKNKGLMMGYRFNLLGVLYAGIEYFPSKGRLEIINIPSKRDTVYIPNIPTNLGVVLKSERLLDFEPILEKMLHKKIN